MERDNYKYHYYVKKLIHEGNVVIDIGSNLGYYTFLFARWVGPAGKVHSVEPIPIYQKIQKEKAKNIPNIVWYPFALGNEEKKIEMVSNPSVGYLRTGLLHVYGPEDGDINKQTFKFEAEMKIPHLLFEQLERIDYIKCDVEGYEMIVLSDMKKIIDKHRPIVQVEVSDKNKTRLYNLFQSMGYKPTKLQNKKLVEEKDWNSSSGDCLFIHESVAPLYI